MRILVWRQALPEGFQEASQGGLEKGTRHADSRELSRGSRQHNTGTLQSVSRAVQGNNESSASREMDMRKGLPSVGPTTFCRLIQNGNLPSTLSDLPPWKPQIWKKYTPKPHESALRFCIIFDASSLLLTPSLPVCLLSKQQFQLSVQLSIYSRTNAPLTMKACTLPLVFFSAVIFPNQGPSFSSFFILETTSLRRHFPLSGSVSNTSLLAGDYMGVHNLLPCSPNIWVLAEKPKATRTLSYLCL